MLTFGRSRRSVTTTIGSRTASRLSLRLRVKTAPPVLPALPALLARLALPIAGQNTIVSVGGVVMQLVYQVVPLVLPAAISAYFNVLHVMIQTFVFGLLSLIYTSEAVE